MIHTYQISNMTCSGCVTKVKSQLLMHPAILSAEVQLVEQQATITMQKHLEFFSFKRAVLK